MAFGSAGDDDELVPMAEINVTPFIDVMLVLLVIFMITAPLLAAGVKVDLPQARSPEVLENQKPVVLTVAPDGRVHFGEREIVRTELIAVLHAEGAARERHVHVRGDAKAGYGDIVEILDLLAMHGFTRVALVTRKAGEPAPAPAAR